MPMAAVNSASRPTSATGIPLPREQRSKRRLREGLAGMGMLGFMIRGYNVQKISNPSRQFMAVMSSVIGKGKS
jgi:hypothetical protein